jgi:hypothetical protein
MKPLRFPRTTLEAWPTQSPFWLTHYRKPLTDRVASAVLAVAIGVGLLTMCVAAQAQGTCYAPPPIARPGTVAVCVCGSGGFDCHWILVSTRY